MNPVKIVELAPGMSLWLDGFELKILEVIREIVLPASPVLNFPEPLPLHSSKTDKFIS